MDLSGSLDVSGSVTIDETLSVNESVDISNNLNVNGLTTLKDVSAQNMDLSGSLDVSQNVTIGNTLNVSGNTSIGGTLDVSSETTLTGPLQVKGGITGNTVMDGTLVVNDDVLLKKNLDVEGNMTISGNITIDGSFNFGEVIQNITTVNKEVVISTQLDVSNQGTGPALKVSQYGVGDDQDVVVFNAGLEGDALKIDSIGNMIVYKDMNVGDINITGVLEMGSITDVEQKIIDISNNLNVNGITTFNDISAQNMDLSGSLDVSQNVTIGGTLNVNESVDISNNLNVSGTMTSNSPWALLGQTINGASSDDQSGYSVSINAKGDIVAIGARWDDPDILRPNSGSTKIYQYTNGSWNQLGQTIYGDSGGDESGYSVSINAKGDIVAIGAIFDDNSRSNSGSTKMYQYIDGSWNQLGQTINGASSDDQSGWSVSINAKGDIVAIGARWDDPDILRPNSGSTKMYQYINGSWNQLGQTIFGDSSYDQSGRSVSINAKGDIVAIGAPFDDNSGSNSGSTKMYQKGLRGNVTIEDDLSVGGDLIVNGGIYTDNFSVADTTGHTTIGGDIICNGKIDCNEIQVNSMPINSFTNLSLQYNYEIINNANYHWGKGRKLDISSNLPSCYSHIRQFTRFVPDTSSCITCVSPYFGTYLIEAHVIFRNNSSSRVNPVISIDIEEDTLGSENIPNWKSNFSNNYCQHNIFSVNNVGENAGRVSNLSASRIYRFTNTSDKVSIRTFIEKENGHEFKESVSNYEVFNAGISFKYIGNFPTPTFEE